MHRANVCLSMPLGAWDLGVGAHDGEHRDFRVAPAVVRSNEEREQEHQASVAAEAAPPDVNGSLLSHLPGFVVANEQERLVEGNQVAKHLNVRFTSFDLARPSEHDGVGFEAAYPIALGDLACAPIDVSGDVDPIKYVGKPLCHFRFVRSEKVFSSVGELPDRAL